MNEASSVARAEPHSSFDIYRSKGTTPPIRFTVFMILAGRRWRAVLDDNLRPLGQSSARMETLAAIINSPDPSSQIDIAKRLRIEGPTMTRMIDSLTRDGLVERRPAPSDRRTKHLVLTPRGEEALQEMFAIADPLRDRLLEGMPHDQVEQLTAILADLVGRLDRGLPDPVESD